MFGGFSFAVIGTIQGPRPPKALEHVLFFVAALDVQVQCSVRIFLMAEHELLTQQQTVFTGHECDTLPGVL